MTPSMPTLELIDRVIEAHGGRARWQALERIEAAFSSGGLAFALHMQPFTLRGLRLVLRPHARQVELHGYGRPDWVGEWTPNQVRILDADGRTVAERQQPRAGFSRLDKLVRWDRLDLLYFAGYALWNYLSFPHLLELPGVEVIESSAPDGLKPGHLRARFDAQLPSHSPYQTFHIDQRGWLTRHDYTADVIGRWATAANFCQASEVVDGLRFYTRRRVLPRLGADSVLPLPTLVWIELDDLRLVSGRVADPAAG